MEISACVVHFDDQKLFFFLGSSSTRVALVMVTVVSPISLPKLAVTWTLNVPVCRFAIQFVAAA